MDTRYHQSADTTETFGHLIAPFIDQIANGQIEVYNEFSLQHELGSFLRGKFSTVRVQFERNVSFFFPRESSFIKREIDISVFSADVKELKWAIELKYPRNGQYPEQMYSFCKDILFAEQLRAAGFSRAALLIFIDDDLFCRGPKEGIYGFFRGGRPLHGVVRKPTGAKDTEITVRGSYTVNWQTISERLKFSAVEVAGDTEHV
jgi:hypothetical protein